MAGHRHLELDAPGPERVVIVRAVDGEGIDLPRKVRQFGRLLGHLGHRAAPFAGNGDRFHAQFADRVFELGDGFFRRMHGDQGRRRQAVGHVLEHVRIHGVHAPVQRLAQLRITHLHGAQPFAGIDDGEVQPHLLQPLVIEFRQHHGGAVDGHLARGRGPETTAVALAAFLLLGLQLVRHLGPGDLLDEVVERERPLDHMRVGIDDRMVDAAADVPDLARRLPDCVHLHSP